MTDESVWNWYLVAALHDIGKILLNTKGRWSDRENDHNDLARTFNPSDYPNVSKYAPRLAQLIGQDTVDRIKKQHETHATGEPLRRAVRIADAVHKAMHEIVDEDRNGYETGAFREAHPEWAKTLDNLLFYPSFYPYYGLPVEGKNEQDRQVKRGWTEALAADRLQKIISTLTPGVAVETLSRVQRLLLDFPHTTYLPHLSLGLHQRFTAAIFYFVLRALDRLPLQGRTPAPLGQVTFYLVTLRPDSLSLFYRMRDVRAYERTVGELRRLVFEYLFDGFQIDLPHITPQDNPFVFFNRTGLVFLYDDPARARTAIKEIAESDAAENFRSLATALIEYRVNLKGFFADPNITPIKEEQIFFSKSVAKFPPLSERRCQRCNEPVIGDAEELICNWCRVLETNPQGTVDLDTVAQNQRLGYVFLRLAEPMTGNAVNTAHRLIADFVRYRAISPPELIKPTQTGLFEFLQAVMEVEEFQKDVRAKSPQIYPIVEFPDLMVWVTREEHYYDFAFDISRQRQLLHLENYLSGMLVERHTPFWALMDELTSGDPSRIRDGTFYDFIGGEPVIFTSNEIKEIRRLAKLAPYGEAFKTQMNALIQTARRGTLEELILELDWRVNQSRIRARDLANELRKVLPRLEPTGDEKRDQAKRALFIKNIVRLAGFSTPRDNPPLPQPTPSSHQSSRRSV